MLHENCVSQETILAMSCDRQVYTCNSTSPQQLHALGGRSCLCLLATVPCKTLASKLRWSQILLCSYAGSHLDTVFLRQPWSCNEAAWKKVEDITEMPHLLILLCHKKKKRRGQLVFLRSKPSACLDLVSTACKLERSRSRQGEQSWQCKMPREQWSQRAHQGERKIRCQERMAWGSGEAKQLGWKSAHKEQSQTLIPLLGEKTKIHIALKRANNTDCLP